MERRRFLRRVSLPAVRELWLNHPAVNARSPEEPVDTVEALGRVTARAHFAERSVPLFHCAAMDGIALAADVTFGASEVRPRTLTSDQFAVVDTGDPLPPAADCVVMVEQVRWLPDGDVELIEPATPGQHVRLAGEDLVATEMVLPGGHTLRPIDVAALLSCGVNRVQVLARPRVAILPTGDELVQPDDPVELRDRPGAILETNSHLIAGMVHEMGGIALRKPITPDRPESLRAALDAALQEADIVCLNAGSSAGREDFIPRLLAERGQLLAHGVDMMPGKPVALAIVDGKPVLGIPGYPVSAWAVCEEFLKPLLAARTLRRTSAPPPLIGVLGRRTPSRAGTEELVRVRVGRIGGQLVAAPRARGASLLGTVVRADALVRIPAQSEGLDAGSRVEIHPLRPVEDFETLLLAVGSHDLLLDVISDLLCRRGSTGLASTHVGSLAGLAALKRGECHLAGTHLIDDATGEYNLPWMERLGLADDFRLVHLSYREQGIYVAPDNPLGLDDLHSLSRKNVRFVNRQRGSGTRQLFDYRLAQLGIAASDIQGYSRELFTHLAIGEAVRTGSADAGLGIRAVALALGLGFVPVASERYDLAIRSDALESESGVRLMELICEDGFREVVVALGGYDPRESGGILR